MAGKLVASIAIPFSKSYVLKVSWGWRQFFEDNRGIKEPYKYVNEVRSHIKKLLRKYPEWIDEAIADQAAKDLDMKISRSAVARIRTEKQDKPAKPLSNKELLDMAQLAESIVKEELDKRQLWLNFDTEPELKQKSEEYAKELSPKQKERRFNL